jgi:hypothetical protein
LSDGVERVNSVRVVFPSLLATSNCAYRSVSVENAMSFPSGDQAGPEVLARAVASRCSLVAIRLVSRSPAFGSTTGVEKDVELFARFESSLLLGSGLSYMLRRSRD